MVGVKLAGRVPADGKKSAAKVYAAMGQTMQAGASGNDNPARVYAVMGATGCGKTHFLRQMLATPARTRTVIWSPKEPIDNYAAMYPGSKVVATVGAVLQALKAAGAGPVHIVFRPCLNRSKDEAAFSAVCKIAMHFRNLTFIVDELHTVTKPSWAPDGWSELVMMGRGYGLEIFGLSQRPASVDKDFFSNLSMIHVGRMNFDDDVKTVARACRVPADQVANLTGFQWIERNILTGKVTSG